MGDTIILTGPTRGLGLAAAKAIIKRRPDATLVLAGRSQGELVRLARRLKRFRPRATLIPLALDLQSQASVRAFAKAFRQLDIGPPTALVLSAGLQFREGGGVGETGADLTFTNNHLGHFLLANLLAGDLTPEGRIIFVSSGTHDPANRTGIPAPNIRKAADAAFPAQAGNNDPPSVAGPRAYSTSKLCNILCAYELDRRIQLCGRSGPSVMAFDPGLMPGTGLARTYPAPLRLIWSLVLPRLIPLMRLAMGPNVNSTAESGDNLARLAVDPAVHGWTGVYVVKTKAVPSSKQSYDTALQADLWSLSAEQTSLAPSDGDFTWKVAPSPF